MTERVVRIVSQPAARFHLNDAVRRIDPVHSGHPVERKVQIATGGGADFERAVCGLGLYRVGENCPGDRVCGTANADLDAVIGRETNQRDNIRFAGRMIVSVRCRCNGRCRSRSDSHGLESHWRVAATLLNRVTRSESARRNPFRPKAERTGTSCGRERGPPAASWRSCQ